MTLKKLGAAAAAFITAMVPLASYRYPLPGWPGAPPGVVANRFAVPLLPIHALLAGTALLIGPLQFARSLRPPRPRLHGGLGADYVFCCLVSGTAGFVLALGTSAGPVATAGCGLLAPLWLGTTGKWVLLALRGGGAAHGRWMVRSYALAFASVTLRVYLPLPLLLGIDLPTATAPSASCAGYPIC